MPYVAIEYENIDIVLEPQYKKDNCCANTFTKSSDCKRIVSVNDRNNIKTYVGEKSTSIYPYGCFAMPKNDGSGDYEALFGTNESGIKCDDCVMMCRPDGN